MTGAQAPRAIVLSEEDGDVEQADLFFFCCAAKVCLVHVWGVSPLCVPKCAWYMSGALQPPKDQALAHGGFPEQVALEGGLSCNMAQLGRAQNPAQKSCIT